MDSGADVPATDRMAPARPGPDWTRLVIVALSALLAAVLFARLVLHWPDFGRYALQDHDHDEVMVSDAPPGARTETILFVGNSLTFAHDLPAMLVDIASSDPAAPVRLQVRAMTRSKATLEGMLEETNALAWVRDHHVDDVILQEHSHWYDTLDGEQASPFAYEASVATAQKWADALKPLGATPVVFQVWAEGEGGYAYTNPEAAEFGSSSAREAIESLRSSESLAGRIGAPVVLVGAAFNTARQTPGAPDVWGPDHLHPRMAGAYLAALVFYHYLSGRTGEEATWRPHGVSIEDAAKLQRIDAAS